MRRSKSYEIIYRIFIVLFFFWVLFSNTNFAQDANQKNNYAQFEHIGLNVNEPGDFTDWYVKNMNFKVIKSGSNPADSRFICDPGGKVMFEIYYKNEFPAIEFSSWDYMSFHIAFSVKDIYGMKENLINVGATVAEDIKKTESGDYVLMMRDPWGIAIQFVQRVKSMLELTNPYLEHFAFNVKDSREVAKWYLENLEMKIKREGGSPNFGMFISDNNEFAMLELYQNNDYPLINFNDVNFMSLHLAFSCDDPEKMKNKLLSSEAELLEGVNVPLSGDLILNMRDKWSMPLQFVKRAKK